MKGKVLGTRAQALFGPGQCGCRVDPKVGPRLRARQNRTNADRGKVVKERGQWGPFDYWYGNSLVVMVEVWEC